MRFQPKFLAFLLLLLSAQGLNGQARRWVMPPNAIDFTTTPTPTVTPLPGPQPPSYQVANGVFDSSGNLLFYVVNSSTGFDVVDATGTNIDSLFSNNVSSQIAVFAVPGACDQYYIVYASSQPTIVVELRYAVVDLAQKQIVKTATLASYNDSTCGIAVGRLRADGTRFVYNVAFPKVDRFVAGAAGVIAGPATLFDASTTPGLSFFANQVTLSTKGDKLAWSGDNAPGVFIADLNANGDAVGLKSYPTGPAAGVEFSPDGTKLFLSPTFPPGPLSYIDVTAVAPTKTLLAASSTYAGSRLQLASDGKIYVAGTNDLSAIDPTLLTVTAAAVPGIVAGTTSFGKRTLPYHIAGEPQLTCENLCGNPALIQGTFGVKGNFEVVVPSPGGGIAHYWRDNDDPLMQWHGPAIFGVDAGTVDAVSLIQGTFGRNFEVVARIGGQLTHFWRDFNLSWHDGGVVLASGASGTPSLIQGNLGPPPGNFEVVTPLASGGLAHLSRNNTTLQWSAAETFGQGNFSDVSLIQSTFGGNLEVIARSGDQLRHFWRDSLSWYESGVFASGVTGSSSLIQGRFGVPGNFEVVTPRADGSIAHYWRYNSGFYPWSGPTVFAGGTFRSAALIQSNYGNNLEVVARRGCSLVHYWRDSNPPFPWFGSVSIIP